MKRILTLLLAILLVFSVAACGNNAQTGGTTTAPGNTEVWTGGFAVGYAREKINPPLGVELAGLSASGVTGRPAEGILNDAYITCIAMTDETGKTMLVYTADVAKFASMSSKQLRKKISEETGIPVTQIVLSATHTHSNAEVAGPFYTQVMDAAVKVAKEALADRGAATMEIGSSELKNMSFVRHYTTTSGRVVGDNFAEPGYGILSGHTSEAEKLLQVVRFAREGKKPVVMINWQGHPSMACTGSNAYGLEHRNKIAADYVGFCRDRVEASGDCLFAFFLAPSGNINPCSNIPGEDLTKDAEAFGRYLGDYVMLCLRDNMKTIASGTIKDSTVTHNGKADTGANRKMDISAFGVGGLGFIVAPFEMFDTTGKAIRAESPYAMTFVLTLTNGAEGYIPTQECWDYPVGAGVVCYEVRQCNFRQGTAEELVPQYVNMLKELHG